MVLNDEQNDRFFDTMDPLLYYVNERFRVVENFTLNVASPIDDVRIALVAHTLWDNVEIIDDFVREYGNRLPAKCKELALSWKSALPGMYTLVRYQSGRALLMGEAGVFSVCGITNELEQEIGPAPAYVEAVLLPFEDVIVYDGFVQAYDTDGSPAELQRIQDEFEDRCAKGIAVTGADFARQADAFLAEKREREFEALLEDAARESARAAETLPEGFHRGPLAGLSAAEREQAIQSIMADYWSTVSVDWRQFDQRVRKRGPVRKLRDCLMLLTKVQLENFAGMLGMSGLSRMRKAQIVEELAAEFPHSDATFEMLLSMVPDSCYRLVRQLAAGDDLVFGRDELAKRYFDQPIEPYVFMFRDGKGYVALVPDELKSLVARVDFDAIDRLRRQEKQALRCATACAVTCGVMSVDDAYDQYRALVAEVLDRDAFEQLLAMVSSYDDAAFGIWTYPPYNYIVHYSLTPDYVAREYAQGQYGSFDKLYRNAETGEIATDAFRHAMGRMRSDLKQELESLEDYKRDLVEAQSNMPIKPLARTLLENDVMDELLDDPNVVRLRAFLDERIPDGERDYAFADEVVEQMVFAAIESGSWQEMFAIASDFGLEGCCEDEKRLPALVTNVYNAMPSWENNGWSPQELYEQLTGRKMFYNEDGSVMKVGADDPCPCGSGKKYRDCCGR